MHVHSPPAYSAAERTTFVRLLEMLKSSFANEQETARKKALEWLDARGLSWDDVIVENGPRRPAPQRPPQSHARPLRDWRADVARCMGSHPALTPWELGFVTNLAARSLPPSDKQLVLLDQILKKLRDKGGAAQG